MSERLHHDCAWAAAKAITELFESLLNESEQREAFAEVYQACRALLAAYDRERLREAARLCKPSKN